MSIITIILNICQGYFCPMSEGWRSALLLIVLLPCDPHVSVLSWAVLLWGIGLCASVVRLCVRLRSVCVFVSMKVWSDWGFLDDLCWFALRGGFGPRGRRFQCCLHFLWRSSVVLMLRALLPSNVSWLLAVVCPQLSPHSCPSLLTVWA